MENVNKCKCLVECQLLGKYWKPLHIEHSDLGPQCFLMVFCFFGCIILGHWRSSQYSGFCYQPCGHRIHWVRPRKSWNNRRCSLLSRWVLLIWSNNGSFECDTITSPPPLRKYWMAKKLYNISVTIVILIFCRFSYLSVLKVTYCLFIRQS